MCTPCLPENRFVPQRRLISLNHKLSSQGLTDNYQANIDKFLSESNAEPVPETELTLSDCSVWYLIMNRFIQIFSVRIY